MKSMTRSVLAVGGIGACCAAAVQINQLIQGQAVPDMGNYLITALTTLAGAGMTGYTWRQHMAAPTAAVPEHSQLVAAIDQLFAHFPDDEPSQEAVRAVARAVTERRYRGGREEARG